jgi:hypothetical protein
VHILRRMSAGEEIEADMHGDDEEVDNDDELKTPLERAIEEGGSSSTQPVGVTTVVKNPNAETPIVEEADEEAVIHTSKDDNDLYEQVKAHSIQLGRLFDIVESLQSQLKILQVRKSGRGHKATRAKMKSIKTKKTTGRKRTQGKGSKKK